MRQPKQLHPLAVRDPDPYLVGGERALLTVHRHWSELIQVIAETLGVWIVGIGIAGWLQPSPVTDLAVIVLLAALVRLGWRVLVWWRTTITVSDKRLFVLSGVFARRLSMLPLRKVTDMTLVQPLPGRILRYGSLIVESAGQNQALSEIHFIPKPMEFYRLLVGLVFDGHRSRNRLDDTMMLDEI